MTLRLTNFFKSSQELRQFTGKILQLRKIQALYERVAPPSLLKSSHVMQLEQGILSLAADNPAVAAKLRQLAPVLQEQLLLQGGEVTGIQVKVQVTNPAPTPAKHQAHLGLKGKQELAHLIDTLADSPLKTALQRLSDNAEPDEPK